jgi:hypothetical protein
MPLEIFTEIEQGTDAWLAIRCGIPTASRFKDVLAKGEGKMRAKYMRELAGEVITGQPAESFSNAHMEHGSAIEGQIRSAYAFLNDVEPQQVGFIRNGRKGCSPDSLVGSDGLFEAKRKLPHLWIECMERGSFPPEHVAQVQGQLWVAERTWCDLSVFFPGMPLLTYRAYRDEAYIARLATAVDAFNEELDLVVERVRAYGGPSPLKAQLAASLEPSPDVLMRY